jgi:uncharacterized membrane-anchored protein YhcB (DUF1043 family)
MRTSLEPHDHHENSIMNDSRAVGVSLVGAVIGGIVGYLVFTGHGRRLRRQLESALDDIARELDSIRSTVRKTVRVANESLAMLNEAFGEGRRHQP